MPSSYRPRARRRRSPIPLPRSAIRRFALLLRAAALLALVGWAVAFQPAVGPAPEAAGQAAEAVADAAVEAWLARPPATFEELARLTPAELCRELPTLVGNPAPPPGTRVNLEDRRELATDAEGVRRFTYSAVRPGDQLDVVQVTVERSGTGWVATQVGFRLPPQGGVRRWLQTPAAGWVFVAFSLFMLVALARRDSFFRRWLRAGLGVVRQHRGVVAFTMVLLYGLFALGVFTGSQLPPECTDAVMAVVTNALQTVGATEAYGSGNVARAAALTFYQNFVVVTLSVTFSLALLFGIPAYLVSMLSFYVQAIPFGLVGGMGPAQLVFVLVLLLLELTAYFLVVAGGGILLVTIARNGLRAVPEAFAKLASMLPLALLLLLIGAWYEAAVLLLGVP